MAKARVGKSWLHDRLSRLLAVVVTQVTHLHWQNAYAAAAAAAGVAVTAGILAGGGPGAAAAAAAGSSSGA